jgi:hypothetical protein
VPLLPARAPDDDESHDAPPSQRRARQSLSSLLWGIDWADHLPLELRDGVAVHQRSYDECVPFVRDHYARIFHEDGSNPFSCSRIDPAKERYYRHAGDFFSFELGGQMIGLIVGSAADWSTYYIRSAAILPEHLGKRLLPSFLPRMFEILKSAGLERVEADTSPSNLAVIAILTRMRFNVTGTVLSDRWGAHLHLTRFLAPDREGVFLSQFCSGVRYQQQDRTGRGVERTERSAS